MTLIASFAIQSFPVVFGDLLLTGPTGAATRIVTTPAQGEVQDFFGSSGWGVSGLTQKVNLVNDRCIVAWSGSWLGARVAISELRALARKEPLTVDKVLQYLKSEPDLTQHPASFVGLIHDQEGLHKFHAYADERNFSHLGNVFLSGSGSPAISEFDELMASSESRSSGAVNPAATAVSSGLILGGILLQSELRGGDAAATIRNMFGGGYEIAFFSDGRVQKLSEITYVIWDAERAATETKISHPLLVVKQQYAGDYLMIRSVRIASSADDPVPRVLDEQRHAIAPMFEGARRPTIAELKSISLQSKLLCHCIAARRGETIIGIYTLVQQFGPDSEPSLKIEDHEGQISFSVREDAAARIAAAVGKFRTQASAGDA
jgi:hypothetical protein